MKKKSVSLVAALILMLVAIPAGTTGVAFAHSGEVIISSWATTTPVIDGVIGVGEWTDATQFTIVDLVPSGGGTVLIPGQGPSGIGYVKNDATMLYMAFEIPDLTFNLWVGPIQQPVPGDTSGAFFDTNLSGGHDGALTPWNEDGMGQAPGLVSGLAPPHGGLDYLDLFWWGAQVLPPPLPPVAPDFLFFPGVTNGTGDCTHGGGNWYYEFKKPLNSGDPSGFDLATSPGQTVGLIVGAVDVWAPAAWGWPTAGFDPLNLGTWGNLVLAGSGPSPTPTPGPGGGGGGGGGGCFIATAAYGSYLDSHVETLRDFRDQYLVTNPVGSALVSAYYELSPPVAEFIDDHPALKPMVRAGLMPAVALSTVAVNTTLAEKIAMVSGLALVSLALGMWLRRRAARKMTY